MINSILITLLITVLILCSISRLQALNIIMRFNRDSLFINLAEISLFYL